nr:PREDICTED: uncharacterized protein LOC108201270 [Daucus carota subsp. sativus]
MKKMIRGMRISENERWGCGDLKLKEPIRRETEREARAVKTEQQISSSVPTEHLADKENDGSTSGSHLDALLSGITGDYNSSFGNVKGKKGDTGSLMENSDAFLSQATTVTETETTYVDSSRNEEVILDSARDTSVDHGMQRFNTSSFCLDYELPASLDTFHEEFTSNTDGYFQVENEYFEIED